MIGEDGPTKVDEGTASPRQRVEALEAEVAALRRGIRRRNWLIEALLLLILLLVATSWVLWRG